MLFWVFAALLTVGALLLMFWPILGRKSEGPAEGAGANGAGRVLLLASAGVPLIAVAAYLAVGRPGLPDRPYARREAERMAAGLPSDRERALVRELAAQMERHPQNAQGWTILADAHMREGRFGEAAASYRNALRTGPADPALLSALGEALTLHAGGEITPEAEETFRSALRTKSTDPKSRFFLALAKAQRGRPAEAKAELIALLSAGGRDAPWRGAAEAALSRIEAMLQAKNPPTGAK